VVECTATYVVTQTDINNGEVVNSASVTGCSNPCVTDEDEETVPGPPHTPTPTPSPEFEGAGPTNTPTRTPTATATPTVAIATATPSASGDSGAGTFVPPNVGDAGLKAREGTKGAEWAAFAAVALGAALLGGRGRFVRR
jgi:hypothetical protein